MRGFCALPLTLGLFAAPAAAQVVERNLPPGAESRPPALSPPPATPAEEDATPIGPALRAVILLDADEPVRARAADGVSAAPGLKLGVARARAALSPLLGRPLSRRLIADAQAAVARAYRAAGYPFLAVTLPEQEVTGGALQLRVVEFRIGQVAVVGGKPGEAAAIAARVRLRPGEAIYVPAISDDLDALSRDPYRKAQPVFARGSGLGLTDATLQVTGARPFSLYGGYANSGSPSTGMDRYFAGAQVGELFGLGSLASYQATAAGDALFDKDRPFSTAERPRYVSQAARVSLQPLARTSVEVAADYVDTNTPAQDFVVEQRTYELSLDVRTFLSSISPRLGGWGEIRAGIAAKRQETQIFFGDTVVRSSALEDYQLQFGYHRAELDELGRSDIDLLLHVSPGDVDAANAKARVRSVTQGRLSDARYAYVGGVLDRSTRLPGGWTWRLQAIGQYAAQPLPSTEQAGLGAQSLVRGYTLDDGAYDRALVLRNEVRAPAWSLQRRVSVVVGPYAFLDAGWAKALAARKSQSAASVGAGLSGLSAVLAGRLSVDLDVARALESATATHSGDWRLESRVNVAF